MTASREHVVEINEAFVVHRKLPLAKALTDEDVEKLESIDGVVRVETSERRLMIDYDASLVQIDQLLETLPQNALAASSLWQRMRLAMFRTTDENTRENARHVPHCCNKIPH